MKKFDLSSMFFGILAFSIIRIVTGSISMLVYSINSDLPRMQYTFLALNLVSFVLYSITLAFLGIYILKGLYRTSVLACTILIAVKVTLMAGYSLLANLTRYSSSGLMFTISGLLEQIVFLVFLLFYLSDIAKSGDSTEF